MPNGGKEHPIATLLSALSALTKASSKMLVKEGKDPVKVNIPLK